MIELAPDQSYLALDIGQARTGVARAGGLARLPEPLEVIVMDDHFSEHVISLIKTHNVGCVVVGLPRNLDGEETRQSKLIREQASTLKSQLTIPVILVDETLSSRRADQLQLQKQFRSAAQDSLAACFILTEFFTTMEGHEAV